MRKLNPIDPDKFFGRKGDKLRIWPEEHHWDQIKQCEPRKMHLINIEDPDESLYVLSVCSRPWCARCEEIRCWRIGRAVRQHLGYHNPTVLWLLTMSVKNASTLCASFNYFNWSWKRFFDIAENRKSNEWKDEVREWIGVNEVTYHLDTGFNVHRHLLVSTRSNYWDWNKLRDIWRVASRSRHPHLNIAGGRPISISSASHYVSKYFQKEKFWGGLTQEQAFRFSLGLKGRNRICRSRGSKPPKQKLGYVLCCFCEEGDGCNRF